MTQPFDAAIAAFAPELPLAVALSGGADSTALLLACARRWPGQVRAVHVHHGLQPAADDFVRQCEALCQRLGVPLAVRRVDAHPAPGESPEDAARRARYEAFVAFAQDGQALSAIKSMALAQHADDQAETLLLALTRGAGVAGLAAMPGRWQRSGITWHRPLLGVAAGDIRAWLCAQGAGWIEDPSNRDERYTRNRLRLRLLPVLEQVAPQFRDTFARSSRHAAQAAQLLGELAAIDLAATGVPPRIAALRALSAARQANVLRHWLREHHGAVPSSAQLAALQAQIAACATRGHRIHLKVGQGYAERRGAVLDWYNRAPSDTHGMPGGTA
ncbi:MAG: tRNA lysidine(34) synthetase TilS [Comamonadaceae bacterium]|nr:tRNA lysidine(34) synthetase TilS [Burkholderiales bacterium]MEB2348392.1 tRNA lysidine(34) synthetase TilS [Comamonadaceae bacterium]